tara:strand:- start:219430 stop:221724 length:2295 start_codon:yes stop_codon:yes gene_type:complete
LNPNVIAKFPFVAVWLAVGLAGAMVTDARMCVAADVAAQNAWGRDARIQVDAAAKPDRGTLARENRGEQAGAPETNNRVRIGHLIDVPVPLDHAASQALLSKLLVLSDAVNDGNRLTVVLRFADDIESGEATSFEDALRVARAITQPELRNLRIVSWIQGELNGHALLPMLASDTLLISATGVIGDASIGESSVDETIVLSYQSIAQRRGVFPPSVVAAIVDPSAELARVTKVGGEQVFASGDELAQLRDSGEVLSEDVWSAATSPMRLQGRQLRQARIAAGLVESVEQAAELLDLAELNSVDDLNDGTVAKGVLLEIVGSISGNRTRRWQSNLNATLESSDINTWIVSIDSNGGDLGESASLAARFAEAEPPLQRVAGFVRNEARGDAALIALGCRPLLIHPEARIGGQGADAISPADVESYDELIQQIGRTTKRPAALIRGLLDPDLVVYRYTHRKTGRVRYATEADLIADAVDAEAEQAAWQRGDAIDLSAGLSAAEAIQLGLADGEAATVGDVARRVGLPDVPPTVEDRKIVRFVERLGRNHGLAFFLLFIGFITLSAEANAPGLSVPGFISLVCFALYFWMKFLAGTAEWLELILFGLGLACIAIEVFVVPGFGIFGVGGLAMTVLGVVLMSQTFVIPQNAYQLGELTRGLWIALGGALGMIGGFIAIRMLFPHVPLLSGLAMEAPDAAAVDAAERLADYSDLQAAVGEATTPLRPSGKARFGDRIVQVVSDGAALSSGDRVRVIEVHGTRIVVEAVEK